MAAIVRYWIICNSGHCCDWYKKFYSATYDSNPFLYFLLFTGLIIGTQSLYPILTLEMSIWVFCIGLIYVCVMAVLRKSGCIRIMFGADTLPLVHKGIATPTLPGDSVKVVEVLLQDIAAWLTVLGLLIYFDNLYFVIVVFTLVSCLLHIPGLFMFGKVYGSFFLISATFLAFTVPLFMSLGTDGLLYVFGLHLTTYISMYVIMGLFGNRTKAKI